MMFFLSYQDTDAFQSPLLNKRFDEEKQSLVNYLQARGSSEVQFEAYMHQCNGKYHTH